MAPMKRDYQTEYQAGFKAGAIFDKYTNDKESRRKIKLSRKRPKTSLFRAYWNGVSDGIDGRMTDKQIQESWAGP